MTFQETAKIMAVFRAAYSRYYANIDVEEARRVTTLWASMLAYMLSHTLVTTLLLYTITAVLASFFV